MAVSDAGERLRAEMPSVAHWAYFDHAAVAPLSRPARDAFVEYATEFADHGAVHWSRWRKRMEEVRGLLARLIGAASRDVALVRNTTEGINLVAEHWDWRDGDKVVTPMGEFPSNYLPWKALKSRGVTLHEVETIDGRFDLDAFESAIDERTRVVTLSWVDYAAGYRQDLDAVCEIAHRRGAVVFVDAIQGLGVFPLDVNATPIDFLAADGHKWLLGPEGAGMFYCRREHLERLSAGGIGWNSVRRAGDFASRAFDLKESVSRYEGGSYNIAGFHALGASVELLLELGIEAVSEAVLERVDEVVKGVESVGGDVVVHAAGHRSGIVACAMPGETPAELRDRCRREGVVVNVRGGRLRVSPHAYTAESEIVRLRESLRRT